MTAQPQKKHEKHNSAMSHYTRASRRVLLAAEARARKSGDWGDWEMIEMPGGLPSAKPGSWSSKFRRVYRNRVFAVMRRQIDGGEHLMISSLSGDRPSWHEMQRIKNDLVGRERTAVEIYPPADQVVDDADAFHIWTIDLPPQFSICELRQIKTEGM